MGGRDRGRPAGAPAVQPFVTAHRTVLPNGVVVLTAPTPALHSAMLAIYVRAGSRHETAATNGVSHFLEHILFRGSQGYPDTRAMNATVEAAGGSLDAATARDHACYFTSIHPAGLEIGLDVLGEMIRRPLFRDVDLERQVILEEILDEVDARGNDVDLDNLLKRLAFGRHPLGFKIAGTSRSIRTLQAPDLRRHHERLYTGANLVLAVAGPLDPGEVDRLAARHLGAVPRGAPVAVKPPPRWPAGPAIASVGRDDAQVEFALAFPAVPERHRDFPAFLCLRRLLDDGLSARLPSEIVERLGLAYAIHASLETFTDTAIFSVEGACSPSRLGRVAREVLRLLGEVAGAPLPAAELRHVQRRHRMSLAFAEDSPAELVGWLGAGEVLEAPEGLEQRCRRVERVTAEEVRRVAAGALRARNLLAVAVGPRPGAARQVLERAVASAPVA
jgi:predicted Zn-dependent peptidase